MLHSIFSLMIPHLKECRCRNTLAAADETEAVISPFQASSHGGILNPESISFYIFAMDMMSAKTPAAVTLAPAP